MKMNTRIHACLDGELSREELSAEERAYLDAMEQDLTAAAHFTRSVPAIDLRTGVLQRLPAGPVPLRWRERAQASVEQTWAWFWAPRRVSFEFRPSLALAMILLVSLLPLGVFPSARVEAPKEATTGREVQPVLVQFRLDAPYATSVALAGSFSGWDPAIDLRERAPGVWTATVPLRPGVYDYLFLVDAAEWVTDPSARPVEDDFGGTNSRLFLTLPASSL
jgi:anti-sigma factor RsiW